MAGRKSKCTPETIARISEAIEKGATYELACDYAGIHYATFRRWIIAGETATKGPERDLCEAVKKAKSAASLRWLAVIEQAAKDQTWQAAAWMLERRYPSEYGRMARQLPAEQKETVIQVVYGDDVLQPED